MVALISKCSSSNSETRSPHSGYHDINHMYICTWLGTRKLSAIHPFIMLASRIVRQMAAGANRDPRRIRKESQQVVGFWYPSLHHVMS